MSFFRGLRRREDRSFRRYGKFSKYGLTTTQSVAASSDAGCQTAGLNIALKAAQALRVLRYGSLYTDSANSKSLFALQPIEIIVTGSARLGTGGDFSIADYAGELFPANDAAVTTPGAVLPPGTVSLSHVVDLVDDWYEWDDYSEKGNFPLSIWFQSNGWYRNSDAANPHSVTMQEYLLYEIWERPFLA